MKGMELDVHTRDRVGVQDFVLLEDFQSEKKFNDNLKKRFKENVIYTYIGNVLVSVNPYKELGIYGDAYIEKYNNFNLYELPPHIFAIADSAYKLMREECRNQCILISGESGAGKTEASKKVLMYLAAASQRTGVVENVKNKLLQSNPVLEAFGNAKTNRNDNSSRFGKYMDVEFNYMGTPLGGHILNYLLEKSRVVHQNQGERNFHIFYQLVMGADDDLLQKLQLRRDPMAYFYLSLGDSPSVQGMDDAAQFKAVRNALSVINFTEEEEQCLMSIVASVLHLGNTGFMEAGGQATIAQDKPVRAISQLLGCQEEELRFALTNRTIEAKGELLSTPLDRDQAIYARDALAKSIYERLFTWLVQKLNTSLATKDKRDTTVIGLLDIYGFEIFHRNSFEQFCINYCNEKLQQLFIELTLKSEQEEYRKEGIEWEPVAYFNNKVICDLIEERHKGIISILDEECLRPGDATDLTFLTKMETNIAQHNHFQSHNLVNNKLKKNLARDEFRILHYAGDVSYKVDGFLDKNNDLLFRDLKKAMTSATNLITKATFLEKELESKKRPETAISQFRTSLNQLMDILMSKEPWYIRCIKPNETKQPQTFDEQTVDHQVKYLGLLENLRVRRAGFAYRRPYGMFLKRYKSLSPATWPTYTGDEREGVQQIMIHLGYNTDQFKLGLTKIFIRFPKTLFEIEETFQQKKHYLASKIKAQYRCFNQRRKYLRMIASVTLIACYWRRHVAKKLLARRRWASEVIRKFLKGFITRHDPINDINAKFVQCVRREYLLRLHKTYPTKILDKSWPKSPNCCNEASSLLQTIHRTWLVRKYCKRVSPEKKAQMELKVLAEELYKGKKRNYLKSLPQPFVNNRLGPAEEALRKNVFEQNVKNRSENTVYNSMVTKFDRHGYKARQRVLIFTNAAIYILDPKDFKLKHRIELKALLGVSVSSLADGLMVLRIPPEMKKDKGDLILDCSSFLIELTTQLVSTVGNKLLITVEQAESIEHNMTSGKHGKIQFANGATPGVVKGKNGTLQVVATNS